MSSLTLLLAAIGLGLLILPTILKAFGRPLPGSILERRHSRAWLRGLGVLFLLLAIMGEWVTRWNGI